MKRSQDGLHGVLGPGQPPDQALVFRTVCEAASHEILYCAMVYIVLKVLSNARCTIVRHASRLDSSAGCKKQAPPISVHSARPALSLET